MKTHQENKKTNGQPNGKAYFQRLMMLMLTIMVSTTFVGCDILNDPDDPGGTTSGKIDPALIGTWTCADYWTAISYTFKTNGTFESSFAMDMSRSSFPKPQYDVNLTQGKCETKNGIAYFTSCKTNYKSYTILDMSTGARATTPFSNETKNTDDFTFAYKILTDNKGKSYLLKAKVGEEIEDYVTNRFYKE